MAYTVYLVDDNLWLTHLQLVAFATHRLDEDGEVQDTTTIDDPAISRLCWLDTQSEVLIQLLHQAVMDVARGDELPFTSIEGRVIDREEHAHRRLIDSDGLQSFGGSCIRHSLTNLEAFDTDQSADISRRDALYLRTSQTFEDVHLLDAHLCCRAITLT